ncbi:hypothetical protein AAG906_018993 [Vitis piasezkii]
MHLEDIVMNNVGNPIIIDQNPSRIKLSNVSFRNIQGTTSTQVVFKLNGNEGPAMSRCKNIKPNLLGKQLPRTCA